MNCTTHHICDCLQAELERLRLENDTGYRVVSADLAKRDVENAALHAEIQTFADAWNELETLQTLLREARYHVSHSEELGLDSDLLARIDAALGEK